MTTMHDAMRQTRWGRWIGAGMLAASLFLAGCVTGGYPGQGGYPQQGGYPDQADYPDQGGYPGEAGYPDTYGNERLVGVVQDIDLNGGRLRLAAEQRGYSGGSPLEVYFDRNTQLFYQGRAQAIDGLERGDRISVDAVQSQGRLWARRIEVVQNVRDSQGGYSGGDLRGAVSQVDPRGRRITITRDGYSGSREQVSYDERTVVEYRGQAYRPEQLDPGDVIRVQARRAGNGWLAERIWVEIDARSR